MGRGIGYDEDIRARVERVCIRRELAFAAKLPNGEQVRQQAERILPLCDDVSYWTKRCLQPPTAKEKYRRRGSCRDTGVAFADCARSPFLVNTR